MPEAAGLKAKPGQWTLTTVRHRCAVLSTAHRLKQQPNPCEQPAIRTVLSRAARAAVKRGEGPRKKQEDRGHPSRAGVDAGHLR